MKKFYLSSIVILFISATAYSQSVSLDGTTYNQQFDSLASSGTSTVTPNGWYFNEVSGDGVYQANNGVNNSGGVKSYGANGSSERAFGLLRSSAGGAVPTIGAQFTNNSGSGITGLNITYTGEEWRLGEPVADQIDFQYSTDATSLTTGTWTDVNALDFVTPNISAPTGTNKDGNSAANQTVLTSVINGLSIADGVSFWIRWQDADQSIFMREDGLAVDDFDLTPILDTQDTEVFLFVIDDPVVLDESAGTQDIIVVLTNESQVTATTVELAIIGGTGSAADVGNFTTRTVTIPAGINFALESIAITDDMLLEGTETVTFGLQNPSGGTNAALGSPTQITFEITDNDISEEFFRSVATGDWEDASTWETSPTGNDPWSAATIAPDFQQNDISVRNGHTVSINANLDVDELTVETGGVLQRLGGELFVRNGTGRDITIEGTFRHAAALDQINFTEAGSRVLVTTGGVLEVANDTNDQSLYGTSNKILWEQDAVFLWSVDDPFAMGTYFLHLAGSPSIVPTFQVTDISSNVGSASNLIVYGTLEVLSGGTLTFSGSGSKNIRAGIINDGTLAQSGSGLIEISGTGSELGGTGDINLDAVGGMTISGTTDLTSNKTINGGTLTINGSLDLGSTALTLNIAASGVGSVGINGTGSLDLSGAAHQLNIASESPTLTSNFIPGSSSTVDYNSSADQTIAAVGYANLTSTGSGDRALPNSGIVGISGVFTPGTNPYTVTGSTIDYNGSGAQNILEFNYNNLSSSGSGDRVLPDGGTVGVAGTFTPGAGAYTIEGSTIDYNGNSQSVAAFNYESITLSTGGTKTLSGAADFIGTLVVDPGITFDLNSQTFTLLSIAAGSGRVDALDATATINGDMTVQRFVDGGTFFRYISVPVGGSNSANWVPVSEWQDDITITGTFTGADPLRTDTSLFFYDETAAGTSDNGYTAYPVAVNSETLVPGVGYTAFMYFGGVDKTLDVASPINRDAFTFNVTYTNNGLTDDDGWNLLGNPYPSAIDWSSLSWTKTNVENSVYIRDAPNNTFATWVIDNMGVGVGTNGGTGRIALGQAFWIKAQSAGPTLVATESVKTGGDANFFRTQSPSNLLRVTLTDGSKRDETVVRFADGATNDFDPGYDARKLYNDIFNLYTSSEDGIDLAINALSGVSCNTEITLNAVFNEIGNYQLLFTEMESFLPSAKIQLLDAFEEETIDLASGVSYSFSVTADEASYQPGRFKLVFDSGIDPQITVVNGNVLQSSYTDGNKWYLDGELIDGANGQELIAESSGIYTLEVANGNGCAATADLAFVITDLDDDLEQSVKVFPNPVSNRLNLEIFEPNATTAPNVALYTYTGQIITEISLKHNNDFWYGSFEMNRLASGIYFVNIVNQGTVYRRTVIKE